MSKQHYEVIAKMINARLKRARELENQVIVRNTILDLAENLADIFTESNDKFDKARFLKACVKEVK